MSKELEQEVESLEDFSAHSHMGGIHRVLVPGESFSIACDDDDDYPSYFVRMKDDKKMELSVSEDELGYNPDLICEIRTYHESGVDMIMDVSRYGQSAPLLISHVEEATSL